MDPKQVVAQGYDLLGSRYSEHAGRSREKDRLRYESTLVTRLPAGAPVLDLGCGDGIPTTRRLAQHLDVTGVDISAQQVIRAEENVPSARFVHGDMTELDLPPASFDGVAAFFSIFHVPRREHSTLLKAIATWLRPGGLLVASMSVKGKEASYGDLLGAPMYWSGFDSDTNERLVEEAGLRIVSARISVYGKDGLPGKFLWVIAEKQPQ